MIIDFQAAKDAAVRRTWFRSSRAYEGYGHTPPSTQPDPRQNAAVIRPAPRLRLVASVPTKV